MITTYTIKAQESGERIDALLAQEIDDITRSQAARLIEQGAVTLRCAPIKKNHRAAWSSTPLRAILTELWSTPCSGIAGTAFPA